MMSKYKILLDSQGTDDNGNSYSFLATLHVFENGENVTSCPDAIMFLCKSRNRKEFDYSDIVDSVNDGTFKKKFVLGLDTLDRGTIAQSFVDFAEGDIDIDEIMEQVENITKNKFDLFLKYLREA